MSEDAIRTVIATYFAATRDMDMDTWLDTFAEDAISQNPVGGTSQKGHTAIHQFFSDMTELFEKVGLAEDFVHVVDNQVAVKWTGRGIGKNGREVTFEGIDVFEMNETAKIQTLQSYWNPDAVIAELQG